jgi:hypothetical protein
VPCMHRDFTHVIKTMLAERPPQTGRTRLVMLCFLNAAGPLKTFRRRAVIPKSLTSRE